MSWVINDHDLGVHYAVIRFEDKPLQIPRVFTFFPPLAESSSFPLDDIVAESASPPWRQIRDDIVFGPMLDLILILKV